MRKPLEMGKASRMQNMMEIIIKSYFRDEVFILFVIFHKLGVERPHARAIGCEEKGRHQSLEYLQARLPEDIAMPEYRNSIDLPGPRKTAPITCQW